MKIVEPPYIDPYAGNILFKDFKPDLSPEEVLKKITVIPSVPPHIELIPFHTRLHFLMDVRDFYAPPQTVSEIATTIGLMVGQAYKYKNPSDPRTWMRISGHETLYKRKTPPASAALLTGESGNGKTLAVDQITSNIYPQLCWHESYPGIIGPHMQVVHLSANVPASGRSVDFARALGIQWDLATRGDRFASFRTNNNRRSGPQMLDEFLLVAATHSLGFLHLDEIQNLFHIPTLEERRKKKTPGQPDPMLRVVDDNSLKCILTATNSWGIPIFVSGTPDGAGALTKRLGTIGRLSTMGYYYLEHFESIDRKSFYRKVFLARLLDLQYVKDRIPDSDELAQLIIDRTAGVPRHIIALWVAAHRVAFDRAAASGSRVDNLLLQDFDIAAKTYLKLLQPCVKALLSNTPDARSRYEDLVPRDDDFWALFWKKVQTF